jgi:hypothetical protein
VKERDQPDIADQSRINNYKETKGLELGASPKPPLLAAASTQPGALWQDNGAAEHHWSNQSLGKTSQSQTFGPELT